MTIARSTRRTLLLTGAAEGLGADIAETFARAGYDVVGISRTDRSTELLTRRVEQAGGKYTHLACDIAQTTEVVAAIKRYADLIDVLIHNAGAAYPGRVTLFLTEEVASLYRIDPKEGWRNLAEDGIEVHDVDGDTNAMFHAQFVNALAEKLKSCVTRASESEPESAAKLQSATPDAFADRPKLVPTESN